MSSPPNSKLVKSFHGGLFNEIKSSINVACGGDMDSKLPDDLLKLFERMAKIGFSWGNERSSQQQKRRTCDNQTIKALTQHLY